MRNIIAVVVLSFAVASPALAVPIQWTVGAGGNDHYYEFISTPVTWDTALTAAAGSSYLGLTGYLATITSASEQTFIFTNVTSNFAWLGGSDRTTEGVWEWVSGPEAGSIFFGAGAPGGAFSAWGFGEPHNCCAGEDDLIFGWFVGGLWNDWGAPSFPASRVGFIVEYSGSQLTPIPEPTTLLLIGTGLVGACRRRIRRS